MKQTKQTRRTVTALALAAVLTAGAGGLPAMAQNSDAAGLLAAAEKSDLAEVKHLLAAGAPRTPIG